jgi:DNA-binding NtrC family response regulator/tetratricopeptide (TPR) repeat protein
MCASGRFKTARQQMSLQRHELQRADGLLFAALLTDLDLQCGDLTAAQGAAEKLLRETQSAPIRATALRVLAEASANRLEFENSLAHYTAARAICRTDVPNSLRASVELSFWGWFSGVLPLETSEAQFSAVRKAVARSSHPHHLAELRLCAGRVEARKGSLLEAQRHWEVARRLIKSEPHLKLEAQLQLDGCMLSLLGGDMRTAMDCATRAAELGEESGFFRASIGALINQAHVLHAIGDLVSARKLAELAASQCGDHRQLRVAALDCLANVLVALRDFAGADSAFEQITHLRPKHGTRLAPHWDVLSELSSRVALAKLRERRDDRDALVAEGLKTAQNSSDRTWLTRMELEYAESCLRAGDMNSALEPLTSAASRLNPSPELVARTAAIKALAALKSGDIENAASSYGRGTRIAAAIENAALAADLQNECSSIDSRPKFQNLDDSVALIELAGYPHVLGREAYALLEMGGAAEALALVARGNQGVRCVASRGWSEPEAVAAATAPGERLRIACGTHRDEAWEIVAELHPTLSDRCTGVAIRKLVDTAVTIDRYRREEKQRAALWPADTLETDGGLWVSEQMTELLSIAKRIAPADITVLLTGETGTGKEVLARAIHRASPRAGKPFVPFNCTAVPRDMLESQLFGYRKGSFTGAEQAFDGIIRAAAGGTLFLDEIAEIGPDLQPKLLRFLETHEVHGLGEGQPVKVDVRVVAATNADLESLVAEGRFREDLFYRLNVVRLRVPPLRERREEIPPLIDHYLGKFAEEQKKGRLALDDETLEFLVLYAWPGNVRQLVNEISRVVAFADADSTITPALLSPEIQASRRTVRLLPGDEPEIRVRLDQPLNDAVDAIERMMVTRALERAHGNYENAAKLLGISRKGLFLKRRRWGMQRAS